tara:strand:- start:3894 stop:7775 length:3882 start_codon:yes stop_codon:yes gene_type:complete
MFELPRKVEFQIIDWYSDDFIANETQSSSDSDNKYKPQKDNSKYRIVIFGKDIQEKTYALEVMEFTPYFYIKLPDCHKKFDRATINILTDFVKENLWSKFRDCFLGVHILRRHSFRNFDNKKLYRFARLKFSNHSCMKKAVSIFQNSQYNQKTGESKRYPKPILIPNLPGGNNKQFVYDLYENNIDPLLKFVHHTNIKPVGWINIKNNNYQVIDSDEYHTDYVLQTKWNNVKPSENTNNTKIKVMAYDIECDSSHGDFPLPIKDYTKLARELYNNYLKIYQQNTILIGKCDKKLKSEIDKNKSILENREEFAFERISVAFKNGCSKNEISKVYPKYKFKPTKNNISIAAKKISGLLTVSNDSNSIIRKKHSTYTIEKINEILNNSFEQLEGDKTIQIGLSIRKFGESEAYINYMLTYDPTGTCDKINTAITESFKTEEELLMRFNEIIIEEDPEIITGWNTDGFDTPWLFKRAEELGITEEFNYLSKITEYQSVLKEKQVKGPTGELIKKEYVDIPGRIQMDMLPLVQKGFNLDSYKLDNVSATFINGKIKSIEYKKEENVTKIITNGIDGLTVGNYIVFNESGDYFDTKYEDGKKFQIIKLLHKDKAIYIKDRLKFDNDNCNKFSWCLGKDDVSPQDIFELQKKGPKERAKLAYYCMMDVILCHELLTKLSLVSNNIGMANVCLNPLAWIISRGQGIKILSLTAYFLKNRNYLLPYLYKDSFDKEGYEGAVVLDPNPGIYINKPVAVLDYGSLYPSSMIERNLSHDSIIGENDTQYLGEEGAKKIKELGYFGHEDVTYDIFKTTFTANGTVKGKIKVGEKTVRFVQYSDPHEEGGEKGIIPELERYLLKARKDTRIKIKYKTVITKSGKKFVGVYDKDKREVKTPTGKQAIPEDAEITSVVDTYNDFEKEILDGLQLAFKVTANSLYGQLGAKTSDIYYKEIAASTTATGRERLIIAQEYAEDEKNYPQVLSNGETIYLKNKVVYGDTDSVFVHFQTLDENGTPLVGRDARKKSIELAIYTEKQIQKHKLRHPQVLEYEKTFDPFILLSKKRYVGNLYEVDPDKFKRKSMGIVLKRRDNAPIVKIVYGGIIDLIMGGKPIKDVVTWTRKMLREFIQGKYPIDTLIISKTLSSYYKEPDRIAHKVLADRIAERDPGNKPQVNDRIPFIYIDVSGTKAANSKLQGDKIEHPEYITQNKLKPDYEHYITNQIMKPVSQIFGLCLEDISGFSKDIKEFNSIYDKQLASGKTINESIKKMQEAKSKEAGEIVFRDVLRILNNRKMRTREITDFFRQT